jgi:hypothetical protein
VNGLLGMLAMTASMLVVGWIVWKAITRHEESDGDLQARLDADDRRAAAGRGLDAGVTTNEARNDGPDA